jgi:hypothetical protein
VSALPYPHAPNDCQLCREQGADFEITVNDPVAGRRMSLLRQRCLGPRAVPHLAIMGGCAVMTLAWAPGRLADHGLTGGGR